MNRPSARIGLPMATSLLYLRLSIASQISSSTAGCLLDDHQQVLGVLAAGPFRARCGVSQGLPSRPHLDHGGAGLDAAGDGRAKRQAAAVDRAPDLFQGNAAQEGLRGPRDDAERVLPGIKPPGNKTADPVILADRISGADHRDTVVNNRAARFDLTAPVR